MAANHIGCSDDISSRSLALLRTADLVVFEEDRPARAALKLAGIHRDYLKFNEHHQKDSLDEIQSALSQGKTVIYMSDQGCPTLEDPGKELNKLAFSMNSELKVIPGPSSLTAALSAAPFEAKRIHFLGFAPRETAKRLLFFKEHLDESAACALMDTPYRLRALVSSLDEYCPTRKALLAIDISGENERYLYGTISKILKELPSEKLNFVLVLEPTKKTPTNPSDQKNKRNFVKRSVYG